jgi:hypothetical protein
MIIGDLPSGSIWIFALNLFASFFFQFIGFLLTYLLHTSHAAKFGSRAGLGLTLIQYGFYSRAATENDSVPIAEGETSWSDPAQPSSPLLSTSPTEPVVSGSYVGAVTSREWLAFLFMTLGIISRPTYLYYPLTLSYPRLVPPLVLRSWFLASQALGKVNTCYVES